MLLSSGRLKGKDFIWQLSRREFNQVQSIIRAHYKAPRTASPKFRSYLGKGLLYCIDCGEKAWCHWHTKKKASYYQETSAQRGVACAAPGRYWPTAVLDHQMEQMVRPVALPADWKERAVELANAENNILDLKSERLSLERKRRRVIELYKEDVIDHAEYERDLTAINNRHKTMAPVDAHFAEIRIDDFDQILSFWDSALPEEKAALLGQLAEKVYVDFETGQVLEIVPKSGFRYVLEPLKSQDPRAGLG